MTTVAENEEGQSVIEFLLMLPVMIGLVIILVEVNTAIQMSIVDQQYARAAATFFAFNSPIYPEIGIREVNLDQKGYNQMIVGVDDNLANAGHVATPQASMELITRTSTAPEGSNDSQSEPSLRGKVRVRDTVTLCSQSEVIGSGGGFKPILDPQNPGTYNLPDNTTINWGYCRSPIPMLAGG